MMLLKKKIVNMLVVYELRYTYFNYLRCKPESRKKYREEKNKKSFSIGERTGGRTQYHVRSAKSLEHSDIRVLALNN
jgi:hypothetical protein